MPTARLHKVVAALPAELEPDSLYLLRVGSGFSLLATNGSGQIEAYPLNGIVPGGGEDGQALVKQSGTDFDLAWASPAGQPSRAVLPADVVNANAPSNVLYDLPGLSFPVQAGRRYAFRFRIVYSAQTTATGSRWTIAGPPADALAYQSSYALTATARTFNQGLAAYNLPAAANATSASTAAANLAEIEGVVQPSEAGELRARFASEVNNSAITAIAGLSFVEWFELP